MNKLLVICGPTATGKTVLAVQLAKKFNGELVSADSRQVYKGMDIGTGKDRDKNIPTYMYDVVNPDEDFSVSHYEQLATKAIHDIIARGKLPMVVGGTGLYINAILQPFDTIDVPPDPKLRAKLKTAIVKDLQNMLDPAVLASMNASDRQNPRRLMRKIEITKSKKINKMPVKKYNTLCIGLTASLPELYKRIDTRVEARMKAGMMDEICRLQNYSLDLPAMSAFGYKNQDTWKNEEHAYARRQLTWFKKQKNIVWFDITSETFLSNVTSHVTQWYT